MKSALPPMDELKAQNTMKMVRVKLSDLPHHSGTFKVDTVNMKTGVRSPISAKIHEIGDHSARGYLPSKAWWRPEDDDVHLLFYVQESMAYEARPFGSGRSYIAAVYISDDTVVEYEVGLHIFIDQVQTTSGTLYVFLFGEKDYTNTILSSDILKSFETTYVDEAVSLYSQQII